MPDEQNVQAAATGADQPPVTGESKEAPTGNEDAGTGATNGGEGTNDTSQGKDNAKAPQDTSTVDDDGKDPDTRARLSKQDFIIGRQRAKLAKQQGEADNNQNNETDEKPVTPEDEELITKVVAKQLAPIIDKSLAADDDKEIADFIAENPDFKPYEAKARRFMNHPSRRALPIKSIFYEVAGDNLLKIGAERAKAADAKAKNSQTGGGSSRSGEGAKSVWDLSPAEFAAEQERIRHGQ